MLASPAPATWPRRVWSRPTTPLERGRLAVVVALVVLTAGAWALTIYQMQTMDTATGIVVPAVANAPGAAASDRHSAHLSHGLASGGGVVGWSVGGAVTFLVAWTVMMAAMMFPSAAPMILLYRSIHHRRRAQGAAFVATWVFAGGYTLVMAASGLLTYGLILLGGELAGRLGAGEQAGWAPLALGLTVAAAGVYQLTPLKQACLRQCRTPLAFLTTRWRPGRLGALRMGVDHGALCVGCCWALGAVMVAAGVMSLAWMLLLTLVVFAEKVFPHGERTAVVVGIALVLLGVAVAALGATALPWAA